MSIHEHACILQCTQQGIVLAVCANPTVAVCLIIQQEHEGDSEDQDQIQLWLFDCRQLIQDQLPERRAQLYNRYGPGGLQPLIPAAQSGAPPLTIRKVDSANQYVEIFNGNPVAVDVSDYKLTGSASITLRAGMLLEPYLHWKLIWSTCHSLSS